MKIQILVLLIATFILSGVINDIKADKEPIQNKKKEAIIGNTETTGILGANNSFTLNEKDLNDESIDEEFTDEVIKEYDAQLK